MVLNWVHMSVAVNARTSPWMFTINDQPWHLHSVTHSIVIQLDFEDVQRVGPVDCTRLRTGHKSVFAWNDHVWRGFSCRAISSEMVCCKESVWHLGIEQPVHSQQL